MKRFFTPVLLFTTILAIGCGSSNNDVTGTTTDLRDAQKASLAMVINNSIGSVVSSSTNNSTTSKLAPQFETTSESYSDTINCEVSGNIQSAGSYTNTTNISGTTNFSISGNGTGTDTYNACTENDGEGGQYTINGALNSTYNQNAEFALDTSGTSVSFGNFSTNVSMTVNGLLDITNSIAAGNCAVNLTYTYTASSDANGAITATVSWTGNICGEDTSGSETVTETFNATAG